jgi:5-(carboxyamino)imidazole ribonucleotide synthase
MMQPAAIALGIELRVFAESENSSASLGASAIGDYTNPAALMAFAQSVDVITFDHEHVPTALLENTTTDVDVGVKPMLLRTPHCTTDAVELVI